VFTTDSSCAAEADGDDACDAVDNDEGGVDEAIGEGDVSVVDDVLDTDADPAVVVPQAPRLRIARTTAAIRAKRLRTRCMAGVGRWWFTRLAG
jgi:hypothetical protein